MTRDHIIIAIDGYSSTGKSSFAKLIAKKYGLLYLDSGALYRAVTLSAMENSFLQDGVLDADGLLKHLKDADIHFEHSGDGSNLTFISDRNVEKEIRTMAVSRNVSIVAAEKSVRAYVDGILHRLGSLSSVVMDGRDIGTTVFPDADLKIFMTADPQTRAQRRADELRAKGEQCRIEDVLANLKERDYLDSHREVSPLAKARDAMVLDNTDMSFEDQMEWVGAILKEKFNLEPVRKKKTNESGD